LYRKGDWGNAKSVSEEYGGEGVKRKPQENQPSSGKKKLTLLG